jgi:hypothetical protein
MLQEFYKTSEWLSLPQITLVFFFVFFVAVLIRVVFGMRDAGEVDRLAELPFELERENASRQESPHD